MMLVLKEADVPTRVLALTAIFTVVCRDAEHH